MNAQIVEKTLETAQGAIDALRQSPILLALVIFQFVTLGAVLYSSIHRQEAMTIQMNGVQASLDKCIAALGK